jgi:glycerol kinase
MQFQADLLGRPVRRPKIAETTALGAAMLAGLVAGVWRSPKEFAPLRKTGRVFASSMKARERASLIEGWRSAVGRALTNRNVTAG